MSMRDYAFEDYGLVLDYPTMQHICKKMFKDEPVDEGDEGCALYDYQVCDLVSQFTGEAFYVTDNGDVAWNNSTSYNCDEVYYMPCDKYPSLFSAAYKDINEMIEEFKQRIGEYMPDGYDYRSNIRRIVGTTFG